MGFLAPREQAPSIQSIACVISFILPCFDWSMWPSKVNIARFQPSRFVCSGAHLRVVRTINEWPVPTGLILFIRIDNRMEMNRNVRSYFSWRNGNKSLAFGFPTRGNIGLHQSMMLFSKMLMAWSSISLKRRWAQKRFRILLDPKVMMLTKSYFRCEVVFSLEASLGPCSLSFASKGELRVKRAEVMNTRSLSFCCSIVTSSNSFQIINRYIYFKTRGGSVEWNRNPSFIVGYR